MKRLCCCVLLAVCIIILCGCNSFEIQGLERFNENDCCFGLNCGLLPDGQGFLSDFSYENGNYHYQRNNYGQAQAKTFVRLQYSESIYQQAKSICQDYFTFTESQYIYESFVFFGVNIAGGDLDLRTTFPGVRMFGYNDDSYSLIFIGYLNDDDINNQITPSNFASFFEDHFERYLES